MKTFIALAAATAVASLAAIAAAQPSELVSTQPIKTAPKDAVEVTLGAGYTQGFGKIAGPTSVPDVARAGVAVDLGLAYRLDPRLSLGVAGQYNEFDRGDVSGTRGARGMLAGIDGTYHIMPYTGLDPWVRLGTAYRFLWQDRNEPTANVLTHGWSIARLSVGLDVRTSPSLALAPHIGADMNMFFFRRMDGGTNDTIADTRLNTFVYAGILGRFDIGGTRVHESGLTVAKR
ncbi:MAG: hypothetical protein HYV09_36975 [Deltaproteobacteria bacterium]|nr:hypothetical protein [Deltaproteobacteria bacterium]